MKIGTKLKYRHNGEHCDSVLVVLHDKRRNRRVLYNINHKVIVGDWIALYAEPTGEKATKKEVDILLKEMYGLNENR